MQQKSLGKFLKSKRESLNCSLNKFALNIGIEPSTLCRIENLKQDVKFSTLIKIAEGFGVKTSELIDEFEKSKVGE